MMITAANTSAILLCARHCVEHPTDITEFSLVTTQPGNRGSEKGPSGWKTRAGVSLLQSQGSLFLWHFRPLRAAGEL